MSQEVNNRDNMTEGVSNTSAIIEMPETKTTTISTSETENPLTDNNDINNVKNEKSKVNSSSDDVNNRDVEVANIRNGKSYQGELNTNSHSDDHSRVPLSRARLALVFVGYIIIEIKIVLLLLKLIVLNFIGLCLVFSWPLWIKL
jgi:hypothetical protein